MLTREEAEVFFKDVLGITKIVTESREDRFTLLYDILYPYHKIPFHSLSLLAVPVKDRHRDDLKDVKKACITKEGGLCYTLNVFLYFLLRALGYDAYLNISHVVSGSENNHVFVLLRNLIHNGDTYLAEAGCGHSTFKAVCLDFIKESPLFHDANLEYKFDKESNRIRRLHKQKDSDTFTVFYEFEINPISEVESLFKYFDYIFENVDALRFHYTFVAKKFENGKVILVRGNKLTIVTEENENVIELPNEETVLMALKQYFPEIRETIVVKAYANCQTGKASV